MKDIRRFYDDEALISKRYSSRLFWENRYHNKRKVILEKLLRKSLKGCKSFLDVGCGTGEYLPFARQFVSNVCGFDISREYLEKCGSGTTNQLVQGDSRNLPFNKRAFDVILCSEMIEHVDHQENVIREIFRVSHKTIIFSTPNHGLLRMIMIGLRKGQLKRIDERVGHVNILRISSLKYMLENKRWRVSESSTVNILPPLLDALHFPRKTAALVTILEHAMDRLLPSMGTVTFVRLESNAVS